MYSTTTNNTKLLWLEAITYQNSETMALKSISIMQRNSDQLISSTPVIPWIAEILVPEMVNTKPEGLQNPCLDHADATSVPAWLVVRVELWTNLVVCSVNVQEIVITPLRNRGYLRICLLFLSILISVHNLNFFSSEIYLPWPKGLMYSSYIIKCC